MLAVVVTISSTAVAGVVPECTTESHDLNDGIVPEGWELTIVRAGHFSDGMLWGQPVDGGCWLGRSLQVEGNLTELRFTWDGTLEDAKWGLYTGVEITLKNGDRYSIANVSRRIDPGNFSINPTNVVRFKEPWDDGPLGSQEYFYPLESGEFSYVLVVEDEVAKFDGHRAADGSLVFHHTEPLDDLFLDDIDTVTFMVYATTDHANWLDNPALTICADLYDRDNDGIADTYDSCPDSEPLATVVIDSCDSGVPNHFDEYGCSLVDLVTEIGADAPDHSTFVEGVSVLTNQYKDAGIISGFEKGKIQSCAARADIR
jgi:hypothetical protein